MYLVFTYTSVSVVCIFLSFFFVLDNILIYFEYFYFILKKAIIPLFITVLKKLPCASCKFKITLYICWTRTPFVINNLPGRLPLEFS